MAPQTQLATSRIVCVGGLDLQTPKPLVDPGTLVDCRNYEVVDVVGYKRIEGVERYDGKQSAVLRDWATVTASTFANEADYQVGAPLFRTTQNGRPSAFGYIVDVVDNGSTITVHMVITDGYNIPREGETITTSTGYTFTFTWPIVTGSSGSEVYTDPVDFAEAADTYYGVVNSAKTAPSATYSAAMGYGPTIPHGLGYLRDRVYAICDYRQIFFLDGSQEIRPGDQIRLTGTSVVTDVIQVNVLTGNWQDGDADGYILVSADLEEDTLDTLDIVYPDGTSDNNIAGVRARASTDPLPLLAGIWRDKGPNVSLSDVAAYNWENLHLGWEFSFKQDNTCDFVGAPRRINRDTKSSDLIAQSTESDNIYADNGQVGNSWADAGATAPPVDLIGDLSDSSNATYVSTSSFANVGYPVTTPLYLKNFAVGIPDDAIVLGLEFEITARFADAGGADNGRLEVKLINGSSNQELNGEIRRTDNLSTAPAFAVATVGGASDLWGTQELTVELLKSEDFGIVIRGFREFSMTGVDTITISEVAMKIHYLSQVPLYYVYDPDGTQDIGTIQLVNYIKRDGIWNTNGGAPDGTATGSMQVAVFDRDTGSTRNYIDEGDEVWTGPGGTGDRVAIATSNMVSPSLPSRYVCDLNRCQIVTETYNFSAKEDYDAIFGATGVGAAFSHDGFFFYKIYTLLNPDLDKPRHVGYHANHLLLGYKSGYLQMSNAKFPISFDPADPYYSGSNYAGNAVFPADAWDTYFPQAVTGIAPLNGDTTAIYLRDSIYSISGSVGGISDNNMSVRVISPSAGAVEYTVCNVGFPVHMDYSGISTLEASDKYGDFSAGRLSEIVMPFVRQRSQKRSEDSGENTDILKAVAIRSKNQYRAYYRDGTVLVMTLFGSDRVPMFTKQKYELDLGLINFVMAPVAMISVTDSRGVDRTFASFKHIRQSASGSKIPAEQYSEFVHEIDRGDWLFTQDHPIRAWFDLNINQLDETYNAQTQRKARLYLSSHGYVDFTVTLSKDYEDLEDSSESRSYTYTSPVYRPIPEPGTFMMDSLTFRSKAMSMRFYSEGTITGSAAPSPPHVVQIIDPQFITGRSDG